MSVATLLCRAWPEVDQHLARGRICRGLVKVGPTTIGLPDVEMLRSALAGQTVTMSQRSIMVNATGTGFRHVVLKPTDQMAML